jgi:hypothetical protein
MNITATILDGAMLPLDDDIIGNDDGCLMAAEKLAKEYAAAGSVCCVRWQRDTDGQVAFWTPRGCSFSPHWYGGENRGGAGRNAGRKAADGAAVKRHLVTLDATTIERLKAPDLGDGQLSIGIRRAAASLPLK